MTIQTALTTNAKAARLNMAKRRYRRYPELTKEQQCLVRDHKWIAGRLAYGAKCSTGGYTGSLTREDLESIANFALCVAATRYDPDKKVQFSTFAWRTARGYIQHALRDYSRMVKTPRWVATYKTKVDELLKQKKTYTEIATELGLPESKVIMVDMTTHNYHVSYDSNPEDWTTREFIFNDDDVKPYVASPELVRSMKELSESELNTVVKYAEDKDLSSEEREWAADKFYKLQAIAHGFTEDI
jgi:DNA-directed RNA polymerase specialized sigma subunit